MTRGLKYGFFLFLLLGAFQAAQARDLFDGEVFRDCDVCPEMVVLPPGEFLMGSPADEDGREEDEGPQRLVKIKHRLAVGQYEVTADEWDACLADGGCGGHLPKDRVAGTPRPIIHVNWHDAKAYVAWLSEKTGEDYRLLTEAEWEYAARGGTQTSYHWGDETLVNASSCWRVYCGSETGNQTTPVGSFLPNPFGLFDMGGNVWEWVEDCWHSDHSNAPSDGRARLAEDGGNCGLRTLRGGSWYLECAAQVRSADRYRYYPDYRFSYFGFRVAKTLV